MSSFFTNTNSRIKILYTTILVICLVFTARLFYIQVIKYSYYQAQAQENQLKRYEIPAERGVIYAQDGSEIVPLVLNELRYSIVADPEIIIEKEETALRVADALGLKKEEIQSQLEKKSRYEIIAKKQTKEAKEKIEAMMLKGDIVGVFAEQTIQRVYPQGELGGQLLGFVNDESRGNYGIEEALQAELTGKPGKVKALTDQKGIPLLANGDNIQEDPVDGKDVTLTLDVAMQRQLEQILKQGLENARSESGSAIIIDPNTGAIKAMANYPTYDPSKFAEVSDPSLFINTAVSSPLEPGSIMKVLTTAAALDAGVISPNQTYYDPSRFQADDAVITNIEEDGGAATRSISDILQFSLNTGATWLLMQMGDGELNEKGRKTWHEYMTNHFRLGDITGVEQGYEVEGVIPSPTDGYGLNIQYANTSFGQGMTATPLQMIAALSSVINGGTYYRPHLVASTQSPNGEVIEKTPEVVVDDVVSSEVSNTIIGYMNNVVEKNNRTAVRPGYIVGGKTGTAEIARPEGGYYEDKFNGTYMGYVGSNKPQYAIFVRVNEPKIPGYAGSKAAGPIFSSISNMLIDNFSITATQ
jgi:cell division protein FtsI/penicillin-binding protein 2